MPFPSVVAANHEVPGAGAQAGALRFAESVPFTTDHARDALTWPNSPWYVTHPAAIAWQAAKA
ncbi:hypothetical protein F9278_45760 [Streptomyces phaeolivaceus]|uniref:Uncharacterized protein n=1 Tax=Streptomyces phaeolivaceus TaxID=2653200 RepID=A0A5P8KJV2_9ACTN|nr:hypothetical protein F9278_45760 [Streptomyces phaeolivaceus]